MPYLYLPKSDFQEFANALLVEHPNVHCSMKEGACYFARRCDKVEKKQVKMITKLFDFEDQVFWMDWIIDDMLVWGDDLGDSADKCFVPVFLSDDTNPQDKWYMGNILVKKYYMAFDMSPYEDGLGYLQVGLGDIAAADFKPKFIYEESDDIGTPDEKPIIKPVPTPVDPSKPDPEQPSEGGGGAGTFFLWLFIFAILGALGFAGFKYR